MFALLGWWPWCLVCMSILCFMVTKQSLIYIERPWGWLTGICEGVGFHLLVAIMVLVVQEEKNVSDAALVLLLAAARICGTKHPTSDLLIVRRLSTLWFFTV